MSLFWFVATVTLLGSTACAPLAEEEPAGDTWADTAADEGPADRGAAAEEDGTPYDPDAVADPSRIRIEPEVVAPGGTANVFFPESPERGIYFVLEERTDDGWRHAFHLSSGINVEGGEMGWAPVDGEPYDVPGVAVHGPGPDALPIPDVAEPGEYRICTGSPSRANVCARLSVDDAGSSPQQPHEATEEAAEGADDPVAGDLESVQADLGACRDLGPAHEVRREGVSIGKAVREGMVWFRIPAGSELALQPSEYRHNTPDPPEMVRIPLEEEHALGSFASDEVLVRRWMTDRIEEATTGELPDLYIGAVVDETDGAVISGLLALADGRVAFVGDCYDEAMSEPLAVYAEELDRSAQDVLDDVVTDEDALDAFTAWEQSRSPDGEAESPAWEEQPPTMRRLGAAPEHVLDEAVGLWIAFEVEAELPDGVVVCLRSEFARSDCVDLSSSGSISYAVPAMPGYDLEFVRSVENADGTVSDRAEVVTLPADEVDRIGRSETSDEPVGIHLQVEASGTGPATSVELTLTERPVDELHEVMGTTSGAP